MIGTGPLLGFPGGFWKLFARPPPELWSHMTFGPFPLPACPPPPPPTISRVAAELTLPGQVLDDIEQVRTSLAPPPELAYTSAQSPLLPLHTTGGG
jgi:hypothetical protein